MPIPFKAEAKRYPSRGHSRYPHSANVIVCMHAGPILLCTYAALHPVLQDSGKEVPLSRYGDDFSARLVPGALAHGDAYCVRIYTHDGRTLSRRDPYARSAEYDSDWCFLDDPAGFEWSAPAREHAPRPYDEYLIYEMHVGSFTPEVRCCTAVCGGQDLDRLTCGMIVPEISFLIILMWLGGKA